MSYMEVDRHKIKVIGIDFDIEPLFLGNILQCYREISDYGNDEHRNNQRK